MDATSTEQRDYMSDDARWEAVRRRDPRADGHFFFCVKTTGVYCRPSCAARPAKRANVSFYATSAAAERAGFRPCRRCRPDQPPDGRNRQIVTAACRTIESSEEPPGLDDLAMQAGMSPYHFHRVFKRFVGVTPRAYAAAHRQNRVGNELRSGAGVTEAFYAAGFGSSSRFYELAPDILGMKPLAYRDGGAGEAIWCAVGRSSIGYVLVAATERGVCAILLGDSPTGLIDELGTRFPKAILGPPKADFAAVVQAVIHLIDNPTRPSELPLDIRGTAFQRRVWEILRRIPPGETASYTQVAERLGMPRSARAVAGACAANPLAVAIPCHRVVASDGELAGYRWGIERKRRLLERESR